ncbi:MAG: 50S ribosomal protein L11 methyltransferase [bacterium]
MPAEKARPWTSVTFTGDNATLEIISGFLDDELTEGAVLEGSLLHVFLDPKHDPLEILILLQRFADNLVHEGLLDSQTLSLEEVEHVDWVARWRARLGAVRVGERFVVVPPDIEAETKAGDIVLRLEPRMAFGTGEHPTTRMALELLESIVPEGGVVLDMGCGNGILAIGALLRGAGEAVAVDHEEESVKETSENADLHGVGKHIHVIRGDATTFTAHLKADLLLANIFLTPILRGLDNWLSMLRPGGWAVLTGVRLDEEGPILLKECTLRGFAVDKTLDEDGWMAVRLRYAKG